MNLFETVKQIVNTEPGVLLHCLTESSNYMLKELMFSDKYKTYHTLQDKFCNAVVDLNYEVIDKIKRSGDTHLILLQNIQAEIYQYYTLLKKLEIDKELDNMHLLQDIGVHNLKNCKRFTRFFDDNVKKDSICNYHLENLKTYIGKYFDNSDNPSLKKLCKHSIVEQTKLYDKLIECFKIYPLDFMPTIFLFYVIKN